MRRGLGWIVFKPVLNGLQHREPRRNPSRWGFAKAGETELNNVQPARETIVALEHKEEEQRGVYGARGEWRICFVVNNTVSVKF